MKPEHWSKELTSNLSGKGDGTGEVEGMSLCRKRLGICPAGVIGVIKTMSPTVSWAFGVALVLRSEGFFHCSGLLRCWRSRALHLREACTEHTLLRGGEDCPTPGNVFELRPPQRRDS